MLGSKLCLRGAMLVKIPEVRFVYEVVLLLLLECWVLVNWQVVLDFRATLGGSTTQLRPITYVVSSSKTSRLLGIVLVLVDSSYIPGLVILYIYNIGVVSSFGSLRDRLFYMEIRAKKLFNILMICDYLLIVFEGYCCVVYLPHTSLLSSPIGPPNTGSQSRMPDLPS